MFDKVCIRSDNTLYVLDRLDNIDFYSEINNEEEINKDDICLITQNTLDKDHISLECGHKFNYDAIFNDIINHKTSLTSKLGGMPEGYYHHAKFAEQKSCGQAS